MWGPWRLLLSYGRRVLLCRALGPVVDNSSAEDTSEVDSRAQDHCSSDEE